MTHWYSTLCATLANIYTMNKELQANTCTRICMLLFSSNFLLLFPFYSTLFFYRFCFFSQFFVFLCFLCSRSFRFLLKMNHAERFLSRVSCIHWGEYIKRNAFCSFRSVCIWRSQSVDRNSRKKILVFSLFLLINSPFFVLISIFGCAELAIFKWVWILLKNYIGKLFIFILSTQHFQNNNENLQQ